MAVISARKETEIQEEKVMAFFIRAVSPLA